MNSSKNNSMNDSQTSFRLGQGIIYSQSDNRGDVLEIDDDQENRGTAVNNAVAVSSRHNFDEEAMCTPIFNTPVTKRSRDDDGSGSEDEEPDFIQPKRIRTDWQRVTQTQEWGDMGIGLAPQPPSVIEGTFRNIFSMEDKNHQKSAWRELGNPQQLPKFRSEKLMATQFSYVRRIAGGRSCEVMEVIGKLDGVKYAIKKYKNDKTNMQQFVKEVQAMALVHDHTNILSYYNAWIEKDIYQDKKCYFGYLQLQLCEKTLAEFLKINGGKISESEAQSVMKQMVAALGHMHNKQIAHLDIKPENIFVVQKAGEQNRYLLGDFGQAAPLDSQGLAVEPGDCRYAAKELLCGSYGRLDLADMYSLGVMLYQCVTGINPKLKQQFQNIRNGLLPEKLNPKNTFHQKIMSLIDATPEKRISKPELLHARSTLPFAGRKKL